MIGYQHLRWDAKCRGEHAVHQGANIVALRAIVGRREVSLEDVGVRPYCRDSCFAPVGTHDVHTLRDCRGRFFGTVGTELVRDVTSYEVQ